MLSNFSLVSQFSSYIGLYAQNDPGIGNYTDRLIAHIHKRFLLSFKMYQKFRNVRLFTYLKKEMIKTSLLKPLTSSVSQLFRCIFGFVTFYII